MSKNIYQVVWTEIHCQFVKAKDKEQAIENVLKQQDLLYKEIVELGEKKPVAQKIDKKEFDKLELK